MTASLLELALGAIGGTLIALGLEPALTGARIAAVIVGTALLTFAIGEATADARPARQAASTAYCLTGTMADGTPTRRRSAASNRHPLGTRIRLTSRQAGPGGLRLYVIRDRIGHGSQLDLWTGSCRTATRYGRRTVAYRIGWAR